MITDGKPSMTTIKQFLGLNMNETGETQLKLGEASRMKNFRITKDYKLDKMYGYKELYSTSENPVRANWVGLLGNQEVNVYVAGGKVYNNGTEIGTITDDITSIFEFNQCLYFLNGHEYKKWNGVSFNNVYGYVPKIKISTTPEGVGTDYEPINLLTSKKRQTFSPDGTSTEFYLAEKKLNSIDTVKLNGVSQTVQKDLINGKITFSTAPAQGVDTLEVSWTGIAGGTESHIWKNYYCQKYGLANDTRVFLYGNNNAKNRIYFSDLADGVPSVEYFPATNFIDVGSSNTAVTDINRQYDRLIINKESETYYSTYEQIKDSTGQTIIAFPTYPLNSSHGMVAKGQGQLLDNYVTTIDNSGIIQWTQTNTKDERNVAVVSQKVAQWLNLKDLTKAVTLDYQEDKEYWLAIDRQVMIFNYSNGTFYLLEFPINVATLKSYNGEIYMGTLDGKIMRFNKEETTYNNEIINAEWHSGYYDFEIEYKRKTMRILWITLKPWWKTSLIINYVSDRDSGSDEKELTSNCFTYKNWTYPEFTYNTINPVKPFRIKLKAKKFAFLKLILSNNKKDDKLTIDSISIQKSYGGFVK